MKSRGDFRLGRRVLLAAALLSFTSTLLAVGPTVSNVRSAQRAGTQLVDIDYDLADADSATLTVSIAVSTNGGASYTLPATSFTGALGVSVTPGVNKRITWNAGVDWPNKFSANVRFRVTASDDTAPSSMALIPAGSFTMGNCMNSSEGNSVELPLHTVYVSAFYMDKYEVTKALWDEVKAWNGGNGYSFGWSASGKAADHPIQEVLWSDAVMWCNARSEKDGLTPCYYTDAGLTTIYKSGTVNPYVKWSANGYRLPTEAEWEKAARGGVSGHRFPWADTDTINLSRANYYSYWSGGVPYYPYDVNPTEGRDPMFAIYPYTSPVGYFAANGYGLYDMAGNATEWCWDWYQSDWYGQAGATQSDTRGPPGPLTGRVLRGGEASTSAYGVRCACRRFREVYITETGIGFRCVRGL